MFVAVHNVTYYQNLWNKYEEFQKNNELRRRHNSFISPDSAIVEPLTLLVTEFLITPAKYGYKLAKRVSVKISSSFSKELGERVDEAWHDPISTETMLKIGNFIQSNARKVALRAPTSLPILWYLDASLISFARHTYIVSKDLNALLRIPQLLRSRLSREASIDPSAPAPSLIGKTWRVIKWATSVAKDKVFYLIHLIIKAIRFPLECMPLLKRSLDKLDAGLERIRQIIHNALLVGAQEAITRSERKIRHRVVERVAEATARQCIGFIVSSALRIGIGAVSYLAAKRTFVYFSGKEDLPIEAFYIGILGIKMVGAYLWIRCVTPTVQSFYKDYQGKFDPDAPAFFELPNLFDRANLAFIYRCLKK